MVIAALVSIQCDEVLGQGDCLIRSCVGNRWVIHWFVDSQRCNGGVGCSIWINHCESTRGKKYWKSVKMDFCQLLSSKVNFFWHFFKHPLKQSHWLDYTNFCFRNTYPSAKVEKKFRRLFSNTAFNLWEKKKKPSYSGYQMKPFPCSQWQLHQFQTDFTANSLKNLLSKKKGIYSSAIVEQSLLTLTSNATLDVQKLCL